MEDLLKLPTVSVCLLCYNQSDIIGQTIQAVLNQTIRAHEILVVDDGSHDDSSEVIASYPVTLIRHKHNRGRFKARSTLLEHATGDIVAWVDGDAFAHPKMLAALLREYGPPDVGGVGGRGIEANLRTVADEWRRRHATQQWPARTETPKFLWGLCMSFRRDVMIQAGGFRSAGEDVDLSQRIQKLGYRLIYTPDAIVYHQRTDTLGSLCHMLNRWWFASYLVDANNGSARIQKQLRIIGQDLLDYTRHDLFIQPDMRMVVIDVLVVFVKLWAVLRALLHVRRQTARKELGI